MDVRTHFKPDTYQYTSTQSKDALDFYLEWLAVVLLLCSFTW